MRRLSAAAADGLDGGRGRRPQASLSTLTLEGERVQTATFPVPTVEDLSDAGSAHLLWQATRLTLREGAAPFRSLGRISVRPRVYQFVPLLMALRLDPVRLLIADDVGVGKTIEALLIARELLDRGEIKRFCVLCPPYLCEQWQKELAEKFNLDAAVIRPASAPQPGAGNRGAARPTPHHGDGYAAQRNRERIPLAARVAAAGIRRRG